MTYQYLGKRRKCESSFKRFNYQKVSDALSRVYMRTSNKTLLKYGADRDMAKRRVVIIPSDGRLQAILDFTYTLKRLSTRACIL